MAAAIDRRVRVDVSSSAKFSVSSDRFRLGHKALKPVEAVVEAMSREFSFRPNVKIDISSGVPDSAGLGSSASIMVALAAALARFRSLRLGREELTDFAMLGEKEVHGHPSGIDVSICSLGGVILFRVGERPRPVVFEGTRKLILAFSGERRSTRTLIDRVSRMKERYPALFTGLAESASDVSMLAAERLARGDMKGLGRLLTFNHAVLSTVGASDALLDSLVDSLLALGCSGAKLTGAGGGGSVLAVAPKGKEKSTIAAVRARGFEAFEAKLPVGGVESWLRR